MPPPKRPLPTDAEALDILRRRRTRPAPRPAPPAGRSLAPTLKVLEAKFGHGMGGLQARWAEIVGEALARRSEPVKLIKSRTGEGSTLELRVDGPSAALIQHQVPQIVSRLDLVLGKGAVTRLRIVQGPIRNAAAATKPPPRRKAPLDAGTEAALAKDLADAPEGPLKAALLKLGREVLRNGPRGGQRGG
jgi:hypothetical protein